jgi:hypothetical protein
VASGFNSLLVAPDVQLSLLSTGQQSLLHHVGYKSGKLTLSAGSPKKFDQNMTKKIEVQKLDFHTAILKAVLKGFAVPATAYVQLEKILTTIGDNITFSKSKTQEKQQYWLMLTRYDYQPLTQSAQPVIRVISFSIDQKMSK